MIGTQPLSRRNFHSLFKNEVVPVYCLHQGFTHLVGYHLFQSPAVRSPHVPSKGDRLRIGTKVSWFSRVSFSQECCKPGDTCYVISSRILVFQVREILFNGCCIIPREAYGREIISKALLKKCYCSS